MGIRAKFILFTVGVVAVLTGLSLLVIRRSLESQVQEDLSRQLARTQSVFETFMADRASWLRSQCRVVAEDPRFTATLDIPAADPDYHERTVLREAERFQHIIGSDLFAVYGREGRVLTRLTVMTDTSADLSGLPSIGAAVSGKALGATWELSGRPLYAASVPIVSPESLALVPGVVPVAGDSVARPIEPESIVGTFTIGYRSVVETPVLIEDMVGVAGGGLSEALEGKREASFLAHDMLKAFGADFAAITDADGRVLGVSTRTFSSGTNDGSEAHVIAGLAGRETSGLRVGAGGLVQVCVVPVWSGSEIIGVLETGFTIDREVAFGLKDLMQTEVSFLVDGRVLATTWSEAEREEVAGRVVDAAVNGPFAMPVMRERYLSMIRPLSTVSGRGEARYLVQLSFDAATAFLATLNASLLAVGGGVLLLAGLISTVGATRLVRPITELSAATRSLGADGETREIPVRSSDEVGELARAFNDMSDALESSRAALAASERLYRDLFEGAQDVVFTADMSMRLLSLNQVGVRLFGLEGQDPAGRSLYDLVNPDDARLLEEGERVVRPGGYRPPVEFRVEQADGSTVSIELTTRWLYSGDAPVGIHGIGRDITARREREEATSRFREQLHQAEKLRALGEMAAGVAHNFNNLLTGVLGYAEIIKMRDDVPEPIAGSLERITDSAKRCAAVIRRIQGFGRPLEASARHPVALDDVIRETIEITRPRWKTAPEREGRVVTVNADLGGVGLVDGNEAVWEEILSNLIFNAVDASPEGGDITVQSRLEEDTVTVSVIDEGTGMDEETRRRVFEPFFTTKGPEAGTGLGLSTVWSLARAQDGRVEIESTPGRGTTITISVKRSTEAGGVEEAEVAGLPEGLDIVAVDDEPAVRELIPALLEGQHVRVADSGETALALLAASPCDVVVTDWVMSEMSGIELSERIKHRWPDTKILLLTGWEFDPESVPGASAVDGVVSKPFDARKITQAIARLLDKDEKPETAERN